MSFARFHTSWNTQTGVTIDLTVTAPSFAFISRLKPLIDQIEDLIEAEDQLQLGPGEDL